MQKNTLHFDFNAPVILWFTILCFASLVLNILTGGVSNSLLFSVYRSSLADPLTYLRFFTHVLGHGGWDHMIGNLMVILLVGPLLEEKYGSLDLLFMIVITALTTGVVHYFCFPNVQLLGASGVAFALILASSLTRIKEKTLPLTFVLVATLYLGQEVYSAVFAADNISQLTHIIGGLVGAGSGYLFNKYA